MNKEKIRNFFKKLNNSYVIAAICMLLAGVIVLGMMIGLVANPFITDTAYTARVKTEILDETMTSRVKLVMLEGGRYSITVRNNAGERFTYFGDYGYGRLADEENRLQRTVWFEYDGEMAIIDELLFGSNDLFTSSFLPKTSKQTNPFKIQYGEVTFINGGAIVLLIFYCAFISAAAAIVTILLIKRKDGGVVFTNRMRLIKRLRELEQMLGVTHETNTEE